MAGKKVKKENDEDRDMATDIACGTRTVFCCFSSLLSSSRSLLLLSHTLRCAPGTTQGGMVRPRLVGEGLAW